jgi:hypothetical protein
MRMIRVGIGLADRCVANFRGQLSGVVVRQVDVQRLSRVTWQPHGSEISVKVNFNSSADRDRRATAGGTSSSRSRGTRRSIARPTSSAA